MQNNWGANISRGPFALSNANFQEDNEEIWNLFTDIIYERFDVDSSSMSFAYNQTSNVGTTVAPASARMLAELHRSFNNQILKSIEPVDTNDI